MLAWLCQLTTQNVCVCVCGTSKLYLTVHVSSLSCQFVDCKQYYYVLLLCLQAFQNMFFLIQP